MHVHICMQGHGQARTHAHHAQRTEEAAPPHLLHCIEVRLACACSGWVGRGGSKGGVGAMGE